VLDQANDSDPNRYDTITKALRDQLAAVKVYEYLFL